MKIAIRMDDITPRMDWVKFKRFKALLDEYGIKPLIGVVPDNADPHLDIMETEDTSIFWEYVKKLRDSGWIIAMHGLSHVYTTQKAGMFPINNFSEFAGLPYDEQLELLGYGVDIFNEHGIETDIFMAPGHSYDKNTLKALKVFGFNKVPDGFGNEPYEYNAMTFYPIAVKKSWALKGGDGISAFVYHVNEMDESDFETFEKFLRGGTNHDVNSYEIVSYDDFLDICPVKRGVFGHMKEYCMARCKSLIGSMRNSILRRK